MTDSTPRLGLAIGVISLLATVPLLREYWQWGRVELFAYGLILFWGTLVAFSHKSFRLAGLSLFLFLCIGVMAVVRRTLPPDWRIAFVVATIVTALGIGAGLFRTYLRARSSGDHRQVPAWLPEARKNIGLAAGVISLLVGAYCWGGLLLDFPDKEAHDGVAQSALILPGVFLIPAFFLGGVATLACGVWRTGVIATFVSLAALSTFFEIIGRFGIMGFVGMTWPILPLYFPFVLWPVQLLYQPWVAAALGAILLTTYWKSRTRRPG